MNISQNAKNRVYSSHSDKQAEQAQTCQGLQEENHALWQRLHLRQPEFVTGGVFCLATANAQNRCEFLELLYDLATAEDCRDVWDYFHGHPLPHVREFHQRLCVEFDGADYNDPIVQDALMRALPQAMKVVAESV